MHPTLTIPAFAAYVGVRDAGSTDVQQIPFLAPVIITVLPELAKLGLTAQTKTATEAAVSVDAVLRVTLFYVLLPRLSLTDRYRTTRPRQAPGPRRHCRFALPMLEVDSARHLRSNLESRH